MRHKVVIQHSSVVTVNHELVCKYGIVSKE